jgi:hypothetical protein
VSKAVRFATAAFDVISFAWLAVAGVLVFQEVSGNLPIFQPTSITRGSYVILAALMGVLVSRKLFGSPRILLAAFPIACVATGNFVPFLSLLAFMVASLGLGLFVSRSIKLRCFQEPSFFSAVCAFTVGLALNSYATWLLMHTPWNFAWGYRVAYGLELLLFGRLAWRELPAIPHRWSIGQQVVLLHALLFLPFAFVPSYCWDDLVSHLHIPHQTRLFGHFDFSPEFMGGLNIAFIPMGSYTSLFFLGGENAIRMINLSIFSLGALALEQYVRHLWGSRVALITTLLALTTPYTYWVLSIPFVDAFFFFTSAVFFILALSFFQKGMPEQLPSLAVFAAIGYLCKQQFINIAIPLAFPVALRVVKMLRTSWREPLSYTLASSGLFCALIAPPLVQNLLLTGNPLYPLFNGIFKSPFLPLTNFVDARWNEPFSLATFWNITFHGSQFVENIEYAFGFAAFLLIPVAACMAVKEWLTKRHLAIVGLIALCLAYSFIVFKTTGFYLRYMLGCVPPLSLCLALGAEQLATSSRPRTFVVSLLVSAVVALNTCALLSIRNTADPYPIVEAMSGDFSQSSMGYHQSLKRLFRVAHRRHGEKALGLLVDSQVNYFARSRVISSLYYFPMFSEQLAAVRTPEDLSRLVFDQRKVNYLVMPLQQTGSVFASPSFRDGLELVAKTADFGLYERKGQQRRRR